MAREGEILAREVFEEGHWGFKVGRSFAEVLVQKNVLFRG